MLRSLKYGLNGAVVAALVAVPAVWSSVDKSVHLDVDGQTVAVRTTAATVGQLLAQHGYELDSHDLVAPGPRAAVEDGQEIVLRRGHLLHLSIDGERRDVWTTAPTVAQALSALGYTASDFVSVSRSRRLPLDPTSLEIRTPQVVTLVHDGTRESVATTDATVGQVLQDLDVHVGAEDRLSVPADSAVEAGAVITLQRVTRAVLTRTEAVPYATTKKDDGSLESGTTQVLTKGRAGKAQVTYAVIYVDGKIAGRTELDSTTLESPQAQIEKIGTRKTIEVADAGTPDPGSAQAIAKALLADYGWGGDQYDCLVTMWNHESGWRINAANPSGAYGIPQALPGSKMASAGSDWQTSATTQIKWGLGYVKSRYGTPCGAWGFWQAHNYY